MPTISKLLLLLLLSSLSAFGQYVNLGAPGLRVGVGFGTGQLPRYPLSFPNVVGDKISLWNTDPSSSTVPHYGIGIQGARFQLFVPTTTDAIVFGVGNSASFTERVRFTGDGKVGIGSNNPAENLEVVGTTALGNNNAVSGFYTTAIGQSNTVVGVFTGGVGENNLVNGRSTVALGTNNQIGNVGTAVAIGENNYMNADNAVGIGKNITITGQSSDESIGIGNSITIQGFRSIALGNFLNITQSGCVALGDNSGFTGGLTINTTYNQFAARFENGYRFFSNSAATIGVQLAAGGNAWSAISDSSKKERFLPLNHVDLLTNIRTLKLGTWNYKGQRTERHYGPMAQEFFARFGHDGLGVIGCDTLINSHDFTAVTLSGVQALAIENEQLKSRISQLEREREQTFARLEALERRVLVQPSPRTSAATQRKR